MHFKSLLLTTTLTALLASPAFAANEIPQGQIKGTAYTHTDRTMAEALANAWTVLPANMTGNKAYEGLYKDHPKVMGKVPSVIFVHGSGGINPEIKKFQRWMANELSIASITLDSYQLPDRMTYSSPIAKEDYEKIHALRASELKAAVDFLRKQSWFDGRFVIAGTSEGAVAVARYKGSADVPQEKGRIIYSWSCENNYHVETHRTAVPDTVPVLNIMSKTDKYFSKVNPYIGNENATGTCRNALLGHPDVEIVQIPNAPHTLMNQEKALDSAKDFLRKVFNIPCGCE